MWPNAPEILARAAMEHNIPFMLSTVTTSSIERIGELTEGKFWFQLYHPADNALRDDILDRAGGRRLPGAGDPVRRADFRLPPAGHPQRPGHAAKNDAAQHVADHGQAELGR